MYTIRTEDSFAAAHFLKNYHGKCENLHGHNYKVRVYIKSDHLGNGGMVIDFAIVKTALKKVLGELDHTNINDFPFFTIHEPSAENIAKYVFDKMNEELSLGIEEGVYPKLSKVDVFETEKNLAIYEA